MKKSLKETNKLFDQFKNIKLAQKGTNIFIKSPPSTKKIKSHS